MITTLWPESKQWGRHHQGDFVEGKIKARGTKVRVKAVCTWVRRGTRLETAPCLEICKSAS